MALLPNQKAEWERFGKEQALGEDPQRHLSIKGPGRT